MEPGESDPEDLAHMSPYLTEHTKRFGAYSTHELGIEPVVYDPKLNVDFTLLRGGIRTSSACTRPPDAGCRMPDAGCRMPDAGCRMPAAG
ncbi:hypothetical protein HYE82_19320 [Streptomyces sp. BR123]|uniref:hypothetical protein n=1 Tax=Streptomyces sp. BR123 TaxID=2749828 RepID=UPI0015C43982|nr:hypothetical protein [Streptomyces sp. BR123]NXY96501.1 hypothetical protein [Streptomyces sp. BR123]